MKNEKVKQITVTGILDDAIIIPVENILYAASMPNPSHGTVIHFKTDKRKLECQETWEKVQMLLNATL